MKTLREMMDMLDTEVKESSNSGGYEVVDQNQYDITVRMPIEQWQEILDWMKNDSSLEETEMDPVRRIEELFRDNQ